VGETFGQLAVEWDVSKAYDEVARHTYLLAGAAGGACVVLSLLVYFIMNLLAIQPINQISRRLLEFRQGVFDHVRPVPPILSMEVHRLDQSVNALGEFLTKKEIDSTELARAKEAAEAASLAKTEFLANVSHELRTPLNAINGFSEVMSMELFGVLGDERYKEYSKLIHKSGLHLLGLINDIIDVAKFESGKFDVHYERVDLAQLVTTAVAMVKEGATRGGLQLRCNIAPDLPPLIADGRRLQQVLLNLLSNAIKFTPARGMVTISVTWHAAFGAIVEIADTGIGIPADKISVILEPFGQVENAMSRRYQGSGLGLPIAKKFIEVHGGKMHIETRVDEGTKISFDLPASLFVSDSHTTSNPTQKTDGLLPFPVSPQGGHKRAG
jgi:signal transduction histidine kinase